MTPKEIQDMPPALRILAGQIKAPDHLPAMCLRDAAAMIESLHMQANQWKTRSEMKASLFARIRKKLKKHRSEIQSKLYQIDDLERKLSAEKRRSADFENRLRSVVNASAERNYEKDYIRLCVNVDREAARDYPAVWQDAEHQLRESLRREMMR